MALTDFFSYSYWRGTGGSKNAKGVQVTAPTSNVVKIPVVVGEEAALQLSAAWACVRLVVETCSTLPLSVYRRTSDDSREIAKDHNVYYLLTKRPNYQQTVTEFRQCQLLNLVLHGNSYAKKERNVLGQVVALWNLSATQVTPIILENGQIVYRYETNGDFVIIPSEDILHIKLFGNGVVGFSPLHYARVSMGNAAASDQFAGDFFSNGANPSGVFLIDKLLTEDQRKQVKLKLEEYKTNEKSGVYVLEAGMKFEKMSFNADDAQMLETRRYNLEDVCRFFGVPSFLVNNPQSTSTWGSGIEQMMLGFYTLTIRPYLKLIEDAYNAALFSVKDQVTYYVEHNFDALLRADSKGRADFYSIMTQNGLMTRNEARQKENLPPKEGGDELTAQVNLAPLSTLGKINQQQNAG